MNVEKTLDSPRDSLNCYLLVFTINIYASALRTPLAVAGLHLVLLHLMQQNMILHRVAIVVLRALKEKDSDSKLEL